MKGVTTTTGLGPSLSLKYCRSAERRSGHNLDIGDLGSNVDIMTETTDSGITVIFARQGSIDDLSAKYRLTCWTKAHVLQPQKCGIMLPNQNAAVG